MTVYLDSSATVKLFLDDEGSVEDLRALVQSSAAVSTSRLTYVETVAALAAARRSGRLATIDHAVAMTDFGEVWKAMDIVELTSEIAVSAGEIAETFGLRAGDAVQLASARHVWPAGAILVAWDHALRGAAAASGIDCYPLEI